MPAIPLAGRGVAHRPAQVGLLLFVTSVVTVTTGLTVSTVNSLVVASLALFPALSVAVA